MFKVVQNKKEYLQLIADLRDKFDCQEDWESFFGLELKKDATSGELTEDITAYQGKIEYCPPCFPCVVYTYFAERANRVGKFMTRLVDFATFEELGINVN